MAKLLFTKDASSFWAEAKKELSESKFKESNRYAIYGDSFTIKEAELVKGDMAHIVLHDSNGSKVSLSHLQSYYTKPSPKGKYRFGVIKDHENPDYNGVLTLSGEPCNPALLGNQKRVLPKLIGKTFKVTRKDGVKLDFGVKAKKFTTKGKIDVDSLLKKEKLNIKTFYFLSTDKKKKGKKKKK